MAQAWAGSDRRNKNVYVEIGTFLRTDPADYGASTGGGLELSHSRNPDGRVALLLRALRLATPAQGLDCEATN